MSISKSPGEGAFTIPISTKCSIKQKIVLQVVSDLPLYCSFQLACNNNLHPVWLPLIPCKALQEGIKPEGLLQMRGHGGERGCWKQQKNENSDTALEYCTRNSLERGVYKTVLEGYDKYFTIFFEDKVASANEGEDLRNALEEEGELRLS